ncbi:MAG: FliH/SctL family protein [Planctomycetota bacterium]
MATILKSTSNLSQSGPADRKIAYDLTDLGDRADDYLNGVRQQAAQIIGEAKQQAEQIRSEAQAAGRKAAEEAAEQLLDQKVAQRMRSLTPALQSAVAQLTDAKSAWQQHWEASAVRLATSIAERLVCREIDKTPELTLGWVREALELAAGSTGVVLRLNPQDHAALSAEVHAMVEEVFQPAGRARMVADPEITAGGCRVDTEFGSVDQRLEARLERVEQELL